MSFDAHYRGVFWVESRQAWKAVLCVNGKITFLGCFRSEKDAALAYDKAKRRLIPHLKALNFPRFSRYARLSHSILHRPQGSSEYTGVSWVKRSKKWQATTKKGKELVYLGVFTKEEDAAHAYDEASILLRGIGARTNFKYTDDQVTRILLKRRPVTRGESLARQQKVGRAMK